MRQYIVRVSGEVFKYPPKNRKYTVSEVQTAVGGNYCEVRVQVDGEQKSAVLLEDGALAQDVNHVVSNMKLLERPWVKVWGDVLICNPEDLPPSKPQES